MSEFAGGCAAKTCERRASSRYPVRSAPIDLPSSRKAALDAIAAYPNWYHRIELAPGVVTPGTNASEAVLEFLEILELPFSLRGKRVLDLGTRDGYFAFEAEKRGAEVVAVDYAPANATGFAAAAKILGSKVTYVQENVYNCKPERLGTFDVVFMLGLLYHLRDPLGALDIVHDLCTDTAFIETHVCDEQLRLADGSLTRLATIDPRLSGTPLMAFLPGSSLNGDPSNFWAPNAACVKAMLREANFKVLGVQRSGSRAIVKAQVTANEETMYHRRIARGEEVPDI